MSSVRRARTTLWISGILFLLTFFGLIANEGVLTPSAIGEPSSRGPELRVWRGNCAAIPTPPRMPTPYPLVSSRIGNYAYFRSRVGGTFTLSNSLLGAGPSVDWNFYQDCSSFLVDLSEFGDSELTSATARLYAEDQPTLDARIYLDTTQTALNILILENGIYELKLPDSIAETREISSIDLEVSDLLKRVSQVEFGFGPAYPFALFTRTRVASEFTNNPTFTQDPDYLGSRIATTVASGTNQRTEVANPGRGGAPELVSKIRFGSLEAFKNLLTILLSTLLGVWIGAVFESVLALNTVAALQEKFPRSHNPPEQCTNDKGNPDEPERTTKKNPPSDNLSAETTPGNDSES